MNNNNLEIFLESYVEDKKEITEMEEGKKPNGYWKEFENVKTELENIIDQLGHFPSQKELKNKFFLNITPTRRIELRGRKTVIG